MINCVCKNINEAAIRQALKNGCNTISAIRLETTACTQCKKCSHAIAEMLKQHQSKN